ncbi:recombinase zinc beta ribbon domain-containing protein [Roseiarcus sp.]|uniref:recombinase zinc beta ribbon domain-containing protein n=1 Tax=Roseiarcus sp. TaxID=1969460 RepID=UPI003F9BC997
MTNPVYVFGRTLSRTRIEGGRKVITHNVARRREDWAVLIHDHHDAYISWEEYDRNRAIIAGNANMKGAMVAGAVRSGSALLVGLLRCGRCGRKFKVLHRSRRDARYSCASHVDPSSEKGCTAFSNMRIDAAVSAEVLRAISPLAVEAALKLIAERKEASSEQLRQRELALEQARYEVKHARRQYDAVDPDNRLVAGELERRWNDCLATVARLEEQIRSLRNEEPIAVGDDERVTLLALAGDLPGLWNDAAASVETRKRILRAVLKEIVVTAETGRLHLVLHWQGGDHTRLEVLKNRSGQNRFKTDAATEQLVSELARLLPDHSIAPVLNRLGIRSARGQTWTQLRVRNFRGAHHKPAYREGERAERHELILTEAASRLDVSRMTVVRLIRDGLLPASQVCAGAPYVIRESDLARPAVRQAIARGRPVSSDPRQESLHFQ